MARPKSKGETKSHQQHLLMAPSEVEAIDDWMFANRIRSRGEAIRRLCQIGIATSDAVSGALDEMEIEEDLRALGELLDTALEGSDRAKGDEIEATVDRIVQRAFGALGRLANVAIHTQEFGDGHQPVATALRRAGRHGKLISDEIGNIGVKPPKPRGPKK